MKEFAFSDLNRRSGDVVDQAMIAPVALTKHGRKRLIMLAFEEYQRLAGSIPSDQPPGGASLLSGLLRDTNDA